MEQQQDEPAKTLHDEDIQSDQNPEGAVSEDLLWENSNDEIQPPIMRLPTEVLSDILDLCISDTVLAFRSDPRLPSSPPNNLTGVARVCKRFHDITVDVLAREKTIHIRPENVQNVPEDDHSAACLGGPVQCFGISHGQEPHRRHTMAYVFDSFSPVRISVFSPAVSYIHCLEDLVSFVQSSARHHRGVKPLLSLYVDFQLYEAEHWHVAAHQERVLQQVQRVLEPFRHLRNIKYVHLASALTKANSICKHWQDSLGSNRVQWLEDLREAEFRMFQEARQEMMSDGT
ncbi:MAG: hypothetical protein M1831_006500 [Alyxoria varia]|nr:MAG: hypothetical protein M1831_006500 [Alyxoria varia]